MPASAAWRSSPSPRRTCSSMSSRERQRVRERAHVVAGDRGADVVRAAISRRVSRSKLRSLSTFCLEHRRRPAVLARLDGLVLPVGALDQPDRQRQVALVAVEQLVELLVGVAQVGLQDDPGARAVAELGLGQQLEHELGDQVARVHRLHVDVQVRADVAWPCAGAPRSRCAASSMPSSGASARTRGGERGDLDREVHARDRAVGVALEPGPARPGLRAARASVRSASSQRRA